MKNSLKNRKDKIFDIDVKIDVNTFNDYVRSFKICLWYKFIFFSALFLLVLSFVILLLKGTILQLIIIFTSVIIISLLIKYFRRKKYLKKLYETSNIKDLEYNVEFYEYFLIKKTKTFIIKLFYMDINLMYETQNYFHIDFENYIINLDKSKLTDEQIEFIRNINRKVYTCEKASQTIKYVLKSNYFLKLFISFSIIWILYVIFDEIKWEQYTFNLEDIICKCIVGLIVTFIFSYYTANNYLKKSKNNFNKETQNSYKMNEEIVLKPKKEQNTDKCLYDCESEIDSYEYKQIAKYFKVETYCKYVLRSSIPNLIISSILALMYQSFTCGLLFFVICQILIMIIYIVSLAERVEDRFNKSKRKNMVNTKMYIEFYDDYFTCQGNYKNYKFNYLNVVKVVENDKNFYLKCSNINEIIIIQKALCSLDLISFIRDKFPNLENHLKDTSKFKGVNNYYNKITKRMTILFVLTILSMFCAFFISNILNVIFPSLELTIYQGFLVSLLLLPIPITSIVLGFIYKKRNIKCNKNIIAGITIGIILYLLGIFGLVNLNAIDYSEIDKYRSVVDAKLPEDGNLYFTEQQDSTNIKDFVIIKASYDESSATELTNSIKNGDNWFLGKKIKNEFKTLFFDINISGSVGQLSYYSIYNKTTNEYNVMPETTGIYEIYVMKYDEFFAELEIYKFNYFYKQN